MAFTPDERRQIAMDELGALMEAASERCHAAGWYIGWEDLLPDAAEQAFDMGQPISEGRDYIQPGEAAHMLELVGIVGGWVKWEYDEPNNREFFSVHKPG